MLGGLLKNVFGSANDRIVKQMRKRAEKIGAMEPELEALDDAALKAKTAEFKKRLSEGESEDDILEEAFAVVREASKRVLGMRHFDVQLVGGMVLHEGKIAEMKTGEGKTLVATLAVYLNALSGKGVHVVTVNDYLARRDAGWMGRIYEFLGLSVGVVVPGLDEVGRQAAYRCDITYATNNELGFDYLRDNLKFRLDQMAQREPHFAIVDEVDSILIDEARTPLIISGPTDDSSELYMTVDALIPLLTEEDFEKDEKQRAVTLTEIGQERIEELLREKTSLLGEGGLYDVQNVTVVHHVNQALRAHKLFTRDVDYIVKDNKVVIIDEFTGRMMEGRRYSEGLHQALEAKEKVAIQMENQTLASITFQNYFRMYEKLAGMTGTAMTEAGEFAEIYGLEVVDIPTNKPMQRIDNDDEVYRTSAERDAAVVQQILECNKKGQPVLVGTVSIEKSEQLAGELKKKGIRHQILNARQHEREAYIIGEAGVPGAVTIATNMAGRGTDIQLGGNLELRLERELAEIEDESLRAQKQAQIKDEIETRRKEVLAAGGLFVLGTERHESRRIDNQLRGRSGRQGDPGESKFFVSLEDDLMRIFGSERMDGVLRRLGLEEGEAIVHPWVNKALEKAQSKVEARNFEIRKQLLKFDNVMNDQRKVVFEQRKDLMDGENLSETVGEMRQDVIDDLVAKHIPENAYAEQWDVAGLKEGVRSFLNLDLPVEEWAQEEGIAEEAIHERITAAANAAASERAERFGGDVMVYVEKSILLQTLDHLWREHLVNLDHLRSVVGFRGYAQRDPLNEYKSEAFELFQAMLGNLRQAVTAQLMRVELVREAADAPPPQVPQGEGHHTDATTGEDEFDEGGDTAMLVRQESNRIVPAEQRDPNDPSTWGKVGRNEACPCGSGKKYKHCHGTFA